jgi:hypothetical protein
VRFSNISTVFKIYKKSNESLDKTMLKTDVSSFQSSEAKVGAMMRVERAIKEVNLTMVIV